MVPDFVINLISSGGMSLVLIPYLKNSEDYNSDTRFFLVIFASLGFVISSILLLLQNSIANYYFGLNDYSYFKFKSLMVYSSFSLPFAFSSIILVSLLQVKNRFFIAQISPLIVNSCLIVGIISCFYNDYNLNHIGFALLIGFITRFIVQYHFSNLNFKSIFPKNYSFNLNLFKNFLLATFIYSIIISVPFIIKTKSILISEGSLSIFNYSFRFIDFALVITTSLALILYPKISVKNTSTKDFLNYLHLILVTSILISIFFGLLVLSLEHLFTDISYLDFDIHKIFNLIYMLLPIIILQTLAIFMLQILYLKECIKFCFIVSLLLFSLLVFLINFIEISSINLISITLIFYFLLNFIFIMKLFLSKIIYYNNLYFFEAVKLIIYFLITYVFYLINDNLLFLILLQSIVLFFVINISFKYYKSEKN